jgi:hypothetical protein
MRHYFLSGPVAARAVGMAVLAMGAGRVASGGGTLRLPPGLPGAIAATVDLAAVATAADDDLDATASAQEQPAGPGCGLRSLASAA